MTTGHRISMTRLTSSPRTGTRFSRVATIAPSTTRIKAVRSHVPTFGVKSRHPSTHQDSPRPAPTIRDSGTGCGAGTPGPGAVDSLAIGNPSCSGVVSRTRSVVARSDRPQSLQTLAQAAAGADSCDFAEGTVVPQDA